MEGFATPAGRHRAAMEAPTPTTDFTLIESHKENIRPLAGGRSAATLSSLFDKSEAEKVLQDGHDQHRRDIEESERRDSAGEDMLEGYTDILDVYHRYITFTVQHHPCSASHILPLLESTVRRFSNDARYKQDIRHLKLWTMYSRHVERKEEIWAMLESKDVGTNHAEFYEEWAASAEAIKRKKKADDIYRLGIARKAAPLERLKSRHQAFLARIMAPPSGVVPDDEPVVAPPRPAGRSVLGQVGGPSSISGATAAPSAAASSSRAPNAAKMEIFSDADGKTEDVAAAEWADFGTREGRRKENVVEATPWKGETLPQKRIAPRTPKMEIFKDAVENDAVRPASEEVFSRIRTIPMSEAEMLKYDPLRNFDTSQVSSSVPSLPVAPVSRRAPRPKSSHKSAFEPWVCPSDGPEVLNEKGKTQKRMFVWDKVFKNGEEWSFEEVRARERGLLGREWKGEVKDWERSWHAPGSSTPKKEVKVKKLPSPTVNTKLANEEVAMMFDQTIHGSKIPDSDSDSDEDSGSSGDEGPVAVAQPTPLPPQSGMMRPVAGMVPPTPSPAQGFVRPGVPAIFADENANVPPSASKKFNVFSETPAKTPLALRTPLASSSKPRAFEIFTEDHGGVESTPSIKPRSNIFATPVLAEKVPERPIFQDAIPEEPEDEQSPGKLEEEDAIPVRSTAAFNIFAENSSPSEMATDAQSRPNFVEEESESIARDPEDQQTASASRQPLGRPNIFATPAVKNRIPPRRLMGSFAEEEEEGDEAVEQVHGTSFAEPDMPNFEPDDEEALEQPFHARANVHIMTPIAERTCEYTHMMSALRSSQIGSSRRISTASTVADTAEEADAAFVTSQPISTANVLSAVVEEDERSQPSPSMRSTRPSLDSSAFDSPAQRSGFVGSEFELTKGFTIHSTSALAGGSISMPDDNDTRHSAQNEASDAGETNTAAFVTALHGLGGLPNPCNPLDDEIVSELLSTIEPPLSALPGFIDCRHRAMDRLAALHKHTASKPRRSSAATRMSIAPEPGFSLDLAGKEFEVREKIGEGGYGAVFLGVDVAARQVLDDADSDDEEDEDAQDKCMVAIKVEKPASIWEAVVLDRIHQRLDARLVSSIVRSREMYAFQDESYLLLDYSNQGTLLDVVNKATSMGIAPAVAGALSSVEELVAVFFTIELLRIVEGLHRANFIHGDLKIDNCMVRLEDLPNSAWSPQYTRTGENGWSSKGVTLIDFGRGIDLSLFPNNGGGQMFVADWKVDERDCVEMREGRPWSYQTDYSGLASICYCMLFGKYIATEPVPGTDPVRYKIDQPLKRYWQADLWNPLFDTLLNPTLVSEGKLPITDEIAEIQGKFEGWLEENCQKGGKNLRSMLKKIELAAITARRV